MDRYLLSMALTQIKTEFQLSDLQLGALSGLAFALFYSTFGLFIARLADRVHRGKIIAASVAIWSIFTALTSIASHFIHLLLARIGVGIGEAGGVAPSQSLIASHFSAQQRPLALSIFQCGATIGIALVSIIGAYTISHFGWRYSFLIFAMPGLLLAVLLRYTLKETNQNRASIHLPVYETLVGLWHNKVYRYVCLAQILVNILGYGFSIWLPSILQRDYQLSIIESGHWTALSNLFGTISIVLGGWLAVVLSKRDMRWQLWLPALAVFLAFVPLLIALNTPHFTIFINLYLIGESIMMLHLGIGMGVIQSVVADNQRTFAAATCLFLLNIFGLGIGPLVLGGTSDWLDSLGFTRSLSTAASLFTLVLLPGALCYYRSSFHLRRL